MLKYYDNYVCINIGRIIVGLANSEHSSMLQIVIICASITGDVDNIWSGRETRSARVWVGDIRVVDSRLVISQSNGPLINVDRRLKL